MEVIYLSLHCHHHNDSCIKTGSEESHFNVSLVVRDKDTRQCPQTPTFEERGEPKRNRTGSYQKRFGLAVRRYAGKQRDLGSNPLRLSFLFKSCGLWTLSFDFVHYS